MISANDKLGLQNRFTVEVGGVDLGSWSKVDGMKITFKVEKRKSGGELRPPLHPAQAGGVGIRHLDPGR